MSRHAARPEPPARPARPVVGQPAWKAHLGAAALAAVVCPALVVAAHVSRLGLLAGLGALQALLVLAWVFGTGLPGRIGGLLIGAAVAGGADAVLHLRDRASLSGLLGVLGLTVPALLLHQLSRGVVRVRVTESMSGVAALSAAGASAASYLALARAVEGTRLVSAALAAAGVGLVAGRLIDIALPVPRTRWAPGSWRSGRARCWARAPPGWRRWSRSPSGTSARPSGGSRRPPARATSRRWRRPRCRRPGPAGSPWPTCGWGCRWRAPARWPTCSASGWWADRRTAARSVPGTAFVAG